MAPLSAHRCSRPAAAASSFALRAAAGLAHRSLGTDLERRRRHQFRDVGGEERVRCGQLAEPEVDEPHGSVLGEEDVGQPQVAVGDAVPPELRRPAPRWRPGRRRSRPRERRGRGTGPPPPRRRGRSCSDRPWRRRRGAVCGCRAPGPPAPRAPRARRCGAATRTGARRPGPAGRSSGRHGRADRRCAGPHPSAFTKSFWPSIGGAEVGRRAAGVDAGLVEAGERNADGAPTRPSRSPGSGGGTGRRARRGRRRPPPSRRARTGASRTTPAWPGSG